MVSIHKSPALLQTTTESSLQDQTHHPCRAFPRAHKKKRKYIALLMEKYSGIRVINICFIGKHTPLSWKSHIRRFYPWPQHTFFLVLLVNIILLSQMNIIWKIKYIHLGSDLSNLTHIAHEKSACPPRKKWLTSVQWPICTRVKSWCSDLWQGSLPYMCNTVWALWINTLYTTQKDYLSLCRYGENFMGLWL